MARDNVRSSIVNQGLPLTADSVYSEVQRELLRPVFISAQMAENTFLRDWVLRGETDVSQITRYLSNIQTRFKTTSSFLISDLSGRYYFSKGVLKTVRQGDPLDAWYFAARQMKTPYELNADPDEANRGRMTIFINYRLQGTQGELLGITGVGMTFDRLNTVIRGIEERFSQRVYFMNRDGLIVLADDRHQDLRGSIQTIPGLSGLAAQILGDRSTAQRISYQQGASTVQVNSRFIPELNWFLVIEQNETLALAPLLRSFLLNLGLGMIATVLVLTLTLVTINGYQRRLERLATTDVLTETLTRSHGEALLHATQLEVNQSNARALSVLLFDFDDFKSINDVHGHAVGDVVLREGTRLTREVIGSDAPIVRWGGEEFLVLLRDAPLEEAALVAEQLRDFLATQLPAKLQSDMRTTISVGVAQLKPDESVDQLLHRADINLYSAKRGGKNRVAASSNPSLILGANLPLV
ncbi:MAG: GGDEF domain-containing protein [Pleurocapsa sp. SU_196_0]|nr:GGDEF domain-containing protein [Pleurocapsa sp. SU_196_0]